MRKNKAIAIFLTLVLICVIVAGVLVMKERRSIAILDSMGLLKRGNERFEEMKMTYPNQSAARRDAVASEGQKPFATVLSCSDSRVPVELIFDRGIGDIFVIRVAGNVAMNPDVIGSAEYAVEHLGTPLIVVLGHTECGAVKAAISGHPLEGSVRQIQMKIEPVAAQVKKEHPELKGDELTTAVVKANVVQVKQDLLASSQKIESLVAAGKLKIATAVYDLKTGMVEWTD
jgi:carbonic anhydrase